MTWSSNGVQKPKKVTLAVLTVVVLVALFALYGGCADHCLSNSPGDWLRSGHSSSDDSVGMATLFVAGVLTKSMSRLLSSEQLLWVSAL
mmetsp:Transcript_5397/g.12725  ORF Transcript_5397/g.12725 Transcript_5397/m.12725 type:complete len:89 (-) Transcript_5397:52-318(-)|eukprot:CAMPEP_0181453204 /NCGR_PEP_ID=MMETSP1110-20121109/29605_1 /TAXON_ID=174948 /ORGANISM="Symbiodinium sp., Strain CCMP421" /LENGTH=88 /DNA_ID=CAMNT_0023577517 /DNA_START=66 /DNA_END=332 /DNA_ORIENTATION=-